MTILADSHLHLFANGFVGVTGVSPAGRDELAAYELLRSYYGIERGLVIGYEGLPEYRGNTDHVLALSSTHSWIVPLAYLAVSPQPTVQRLADLKGRGAAGFALYLTNENDGKALAAWIPTLLTELATQSAIISLNARLPALSAISAVVDALSGCRIFVSHLGLPGRLPTPLSLVEARRHLMPLLSLATRDHVAVKLSALYALSEPSHDFPHDSAQPVVDVVVDAFGPSRMLWGSDFSPALDHVSFAQTLDTRLLKGCSPNEIQDIMGRNLIRILDT